MGGGGGELIFVLAPPALSEKWALNPCLPPKVKTMLGFGEEKDYKEGKRRALNPCCQQKSRQRRHASENECLFLTFAGRRGLRAHST